MADRDGWQEGQGIIIWLIGTDVEERLGIV